MKRRSFLIQAGSVAAVLAGRKALTLEDAVRSAAGENANRLWYERPAGDWNEALPIGSGRLGAMIFGGVTSERLQMNEDTLVSEEPGTSHLPLKVAPQYEEVEKLLRANRFADAGDVITKHWTGRSWPCYQPMADLLIAAPGHEGFSGFERDLDLEQAIAGVRYTVGETTYRREYFASHPDQVIVGRFTANRKGALSFSVRLTSPHPTAATRAEGTTLILRGQAPGLALRRTLEWIEERNEQWKYPEVWDAEGHRRPGAGPVMYGAQVGGRGMFFETRAQVRASGGTVRADGDVLHVEAADEVLILVSAGTSYNGYERSPSRDGVDPAKRAGADLAQAAAHSFATLRRRHTDDYGKLFGRVSLQLGVLATVPAAPTDRRIAAFRKGGDPAFAALYLQFARYLTIAASRPGSQAMNLQGMWNEEVVPPWASGYTTNINVQMNYWPVETLNLSECFQPMARLIEECALTGAQVASEMYGRRGWVLHHNTTIWRGAQPVDNNAMPAFWNVAGAWLCQHLWEHYAFTGDRAFLARVFPVLEGAAAFLCDWLVENGQGHLVTAAGVSPENLFYYTGPNGVRSKAGVCMGPTMDMALTRQVFRTCLDAAAALGRAGALQAEITAKLPRLLPYQIGARGQLQEWPIDFEEVEVHHRHVSHLYGLYPDGQLNETTPALLAAARRSLELRGDEGTGWSRAWKICLWARLRDGEHAYRLVDNLFKPSHDLDPGAEQGGLMPNMFCSCPPMQIDGNFGGAAGIVEMLLQSGDGAIHLLPALPAAWSEGSLRGFKARGGFEVAMEWKGGRLTSAQLKSEAGGSCRVHYAGRNVTVTVKPGGRVRVNGLTG